ncbi:MAG: hypothetical protein JNL83_40175 [Myxococcales bacterium]|nr:hypothetical protein [Myxococcales bacterium]
MDVAAWLSEQIEEHAPDRDDDPQSAHRIAEAYAALAGARAPAFGMQELPAEIANRDQLRARALEVMKAWLAKVDPSEKDAIRALLHGYGIGSGRGLPPTTPPPPSSEPE